MNLDILVYNEYFNRYSLLALNNFVWTNAPKTLDSDTIERLLYNNGMCFVLDSPQYGIIAVPCTVQGVSKVTGLPTTVTVSEETVSGTYNVGVDGIIILNNALSIPTVITIESYARRMAHLQKAIDLNVQQQIFSSFIETTKDNKYSLEQVFNNVNEGKPYILVNKELNINPSHVHYLNPPYIVDKLSEYQQALEGRLLTTIGINNSYEKKERMLVDEINVNNAHIERSLDSYYNSRTKAQNQLNAFFKINLSVEKAENIHSTLGGE